jgi:hypothetical protein
MKIEYVKISCTKRCSYLPYKLGTKELMKFA